MPLLPERLEDSMLSVRRSTPDDLAGLLDAIATSLVELGRWLPFARRMPTADDEAAFLAE